eukprot:CAMPEP_0206267544 /NCGR_PEP_ID=MMETSP0047_2-20121206/31208_1 /ASSEMBLY_ACC=CAM_ASM_000192 /TAXON_ID=195065 /ORGANISM="Chroomonas mesostigmatica_cf, Strain CCMP1168" /LENGTH=36 /DNA_ID= /DNA_START= /DNA_END= /DNA_ORIENTATION=
MHPMMMNQGREARDSAQVFQELQVAIFFSLISVVLA